MLALALGHGAVWADPSELPAPMAYHYGEAEVPRSAAMAGALRALGNGTAAPLLNPAGMCTARVYRLDAIGQFTPEAARQIYGGGIVDSTRRWAGGVTFFGGFIDPDGVDRSYLDLRAALAFLVVDELSVGLTGRYLNLDQEGLGVLGDSRASGGLKDPDDLPLGRDALVNTWTLDAGAVIRATDELHIGVVGQNLSHPDHGLLPTVVGGGIGYGTEGWSAEVDAVADFDSWDEISARVMAGGELLAGDHFPLRVGYRFDQGASSHALSAGFGYLESRFAVEASVRRTVAGPGATTIVVGLSYFLPSALAPVGQ